jgi:hypothetical protein
MENFDRGEPVANCGAAVQACPEVTIAAIAANPLFERISQISRGAYT